MLFEEYDADKARRVLVEETRKDALAKGRKEGEEKGRKEGEAGMIKRLYELGNTVKQIALLFNMPESEVENYLAFG